MNYKDLTSSLFWIGVGVAFCAGAYPYRLIKSGIPRAGFFPFLAGVIMVFLALVVLTSSLKRTGKGTSSGEKFFPQKDSPKKIGIALAGLLGYWLLLEVLGYISTTFLFLVFLLKFIEPQRWAIALATALLATGLSYLLFNLWLRVQMPVGVLGI